MSGRALRWAGCWIFVACSATASATVPVGVPLAVLEEGQWALGFDYSYGEADLQAYGFNNWTPTAGSPTSTFELLDIDGLHSHTMLGSIAYGVCDTWDLFLRLGMTQSSDDVLAAGGERFAYDGGSGLAWGLGSRAMFCQYGPWTFGGLVQVTWLDPGPSGFSWTDPGSPETTTTGTISADLWQTQASLAATYQIDTLTLWAGPLLEFTKGSLDRSGRIIVDGNDTGSFRSEGHIEESSQFGVHFGFLWEKSDASSWWTSGQVTGSSWSVAVGAILRPERWFDRR